MNHNTFRDKSEDEEDKVNHNLYNDRTTITRRSSLPATLPISRPPKLYLSAKRLFSHCFVLLFMFIVDRCLSWSFSSLSSLISKLWRSLCPHVITEGLIRVIIDIVLNELRVLSRRLIFSLERNESVFYKKDNICNAGIKNNYL